MKTPILERVPVLTVWEPWATMIALGLKTVENRTWRPGANELRMNDALVIHAGRKVDPDALAYLRGALPGGWVSNIYARMQPGHVRCCATYRGADTAIMTPYDAPGQWHWRLVDLMVPGTSFPLVGHQGIFWATRPDNDGLVDLVERYIYQRARAGVEA